MANRLMWASPETTWARTAGAFRARHCAQDTDDFSSAWTARRLPRYGAVAAGHTVHGMPQIGQLRRGLWVTSGFRPSGLETRRLMAGQLIARSILWGDETLAAVFRHSKLVWAGGANRPGCGLFHRDVESREAPPAAGALARYRERGRAKEGIREATSGGGKPPGRNAANPTSAAGPATAAAATKRRRGAHSYFSSPGRRCSVLQRLHRRAGDVGAAG